MRRSTFCATILFVLAAARDASAQQPAFPTELRSVIGYMMKQEYPELVDTTHYGIRMEAAEVGDLNGDGSQEVVMQVNPHFRQSPTLVIFTVDAKQNVRRVTEGLAPGPLIPLTNSDQLDTHALKVATDLSVEGTKAGQAVDNLLVHHQHVVQYRNFVHMDSRKGNGGYIDMRGRTEFADQKTDAKFRFSPVRSIAIGFLPGRGKRRMLVAAAGQELTIYRIDAISPKGLLKKQTTIIPLPFDFRNLMKSANGNVVYVRTNGQVAEIPAPRK